MAKRVGSTLEKQSGVRDVVFDTTGVGYLTMKKDTKPNREKIDEALSKMRVKVTKLEEKDVPVAVEKYELVVKGVS